MNSRMSPGKINFGVVSRKTMLCPRKIGLSSSYLSPVEAVIDVPGKVFVFVILLFIAPASLSCSLPFVPVET